IVSAAVSLYEIRDHNFGSDALLHVAVKEGGTLTRLGTVTPATPLPQIFNFDLRDAPIAWTAVHTFQLVLQLEPIAPGNGYSATYELDWIAVRATPAP